MSHDTEMFKHSTITAVEAARKWCTLLFAIASGALSWSVKTTLNEQRLEIKSEIDKEYISRVAYIEDRTRIELQVGEIKKKLDSVLMEQVRASDKITELSDRFGKIK